MNISYNKKMLSRISLIIAAGIIVRVIISMLFDFNHDFEGGDSGYYLEVGKNIINYGIHGCGEPPTPEYFRGPLYSFFAGLIDNIFGHNVYAFFAIQSAISLSGALLTYVFLRKHNEQLAFVSSLLIALSPFEALSNGRVLSENTVNIFILMSFLILLFSNYRYRFIISGILLGLVLLSRDVYLLLPIFTVLFLIVLHKKFERGYLIYLLAIIITISPWVMRNYNLQDSGLFISKGIFWPVLWSGTWARNPMDAVLPDRAFPVGASEEKKRGITEHWFAMDELYMKNLFIEKIKSEPFDVLKTWIIRSPRLWFGTRSDLNTMRAERGSTTWLLLKISFFALNTIIILTGILGIVSSYKNCKRIFLFSIPIIYTLIIYFPLRNFETRYSLPVYPFIIIFSVYFIMKIIKAKLIRT
ncbi:glycosyltransferase family 39 protein [bacterium]|nr:glycosyltransferase family 39 protein [bacterium]